MKKVGNEYVMTVGGVVKLKIFNMLYKRCGKKNLLFLTGFVVKTYSIK